MRATQALIYKKNIIHNINEIKRCVKTAKICVSVKADGYGCGAVTVARAALECGVSHLAVATVDEGRELRDAGIDCDIFLYSTCAKSEIADAVALRLTPFIFDEEYIELFDAAASSVCGAIKCGASSAALAKKFFVHLAVDTGMGRIGCFPHEAAALAQKISNSKNLALGGMCTHFAVSDSILPDDISYTKKQFALFTDAIQSVRAAGIAPGVCHCAASAGLLAFPEMQLDMVRPGIITYGYYPGNTTREYLQGRGVSCDLRPVMALRTEVSAVRDVDVGASISYGRTWTASQKTKLAVLPLGYADGLFRRFSPSLQVAINGKNYNVRGRICMDVCMAEVDDSVKRGDEVFVFGPPECGALQTAQNIADATGTISYEIMTGISKRVPRVTV